MHRFALLGAGFIGQVHAHNLAAHPGIDLAGIFDVDPSRSAALADETGTRPARSVDDVLDDPSVDAVLIASSTDTHADLLVRAAEAGKAVICEKPIDLSFDVARTAVQRVVATGVHAMMDFNRRFDADYAAAKALVDAGQVGAVELVQMTSRGPKLPPLEYLAVSGGQMRDQTVHFFDLLRWFTGLEPVEVHVFGSALVDPRVGELGDVDTSIASLRLSNGALCQIDSTRQIAYGYDERIEICGASGMVEAGRQRTGAVARFEAGRVVGDGLQQGWFERMRPTYRAALDSFVVALDGEQPTYPTLEDGLRAQSIAEAATESLQTGRPVAIHD